MLNDTYNKIYLDIINPSKNQNIKSIILDNTKDVNINSERKRLYLLQVLIADEFLAAINYLSASIWSVTSGKFDADPEFKQHYEEELQHADKLTERLKQLGEYPYLDPINWCQICSHQYHPVTEHDTKQLVYNRSIEEQQAIDSYQFVYDWIVENFANDTTTLRILREIKSEEEQHKLDLAEVYNNI